MQTGTMSPTTNSALVDAAFTGPRARGLRQAIHRRRIRLGWSEFMLRYVLDKLGFGPKLTHLPDYRLEQALEILNAYSPPRPDGWAYDSGARYICFLQHQAGWSDADLRAYLTLTFKKTHPNLLSEQERNALAATLKSIIDPQGEPQ